MSFKSETANLLEENGLKQLIPELKNCFRLFKSSQKVGLGDSKFGGRPHLPKETEWPKIDGREATFLCQINLEKLEAGFLENWPQKGLLSFFVPSLFRKGGEYDDVEDLSLDKPNCKVIYTPSLEKLGVKNYPKIFFKKHKRKVQKIKEIVAKKPLKEEEIELPLYLKILYQHAKAKGDIGLQKFHIHTAHQIKTQPENEYVYETVEEEFYAYDFPFGYNMDMTETEICLDREVAEDFALETVTDQHFPHYQLDQKKYNLDDEKGFLDKLFTRDYTVTGILGGWACPVQNFTEEDAEGEMRKIFKLTDSAKKPKVVNLLSLYNLSELVQGGGGQYAEAACFFILEEDLKKLNFERVWFYCDMD